MAIGTTFVEDFLYEKSLVYTKGETYSRSETDLLVASISHSPGDLPGYVLLSSYAGANDKAKLRAAMAATRGMAFIPWIIIDYNANFTGTDPIVIDYDGFKLGTAPWEAWNGGELNLGKNGAVVITVNVGTGVNSLFYMNKELFYVSFANMLFRCSGTSQVFHTTTAANMYVCRFSNVGCDGSSGLYGNSANQFIMTGTVTDGAGGMTNAKDTQIHWTGSDFEVYGLYNIGAASYVNEPYLKDSNGNVLTDGSGNPLPNPFWGKGKRLVELNYSGKCNIRGLFITADSGFRPCRVRGNVAITKALVLQGNRFEGRNTRAPSLAELLKIEGGSVSVVDNWFAYGMGNPDANSNFGADIGFGDGAPGIIWQTGGQARISGNSYERGHTVPVLGWGNGNSKPSNPITAGQVDAGFVPETIPFHYLAGGWADLLGCMPCGGAGSPGGGDPWVGTAGPPVVLPMSSIRRRFVGSGVYRNVDNSTTLV